MKTRRVPRQFALMETENLFEIPMEEGDCVLVLKGSEDSETQIFPDHERRGEEKKKILRVD
jgi:hypothetical protein